MNNTKVISTTSRVPTYEQYSPDSVTMLDNSTSFFYQDFQPPKFDNTNVFESAQQKKDLIQHSQQQQQQQEYAPLYKIPVAPLKSRNRRKLPTRLPDLAEVMSEATAYVGPTRESNWVILDRLMVGAYPSSFDDDENDEILSGILQCGISTFVCLQLEYQHGVSEAQWRSGVSLRPYIEDAMEICERERNTGHLIPPEELKFLHHGIVDCGTTTDATVLELALDVCYRLLADEVIYLHCWGGHGRTGTVVAVALGLMYNLPSSEALARTQLYHDLRVCSLNVPSPQTPQQRRQVERILEAVARGEYSRMVPPLPLIASTNPMSPLVQSPSPRFVKAIKRKNSGYNWEGAQ
jgi:hypothetical protein